MPSGNGFIKDVNHSLSAVSVIIKWFGLVGNVVSAKLIDVGPG